MRPSEIMTHCYPRVRLTPMPETPEHPEGWVHIEVPPGHAGVDEITVFVRKYEAEILKDLLKRATGKEQ